MYTAVSAGDPMQNINIYRDVVKGLEAKSEEGLSFDGADNYRNVSAYLDGDKEKWVSYIWSGPVGAFSIVDHYEKNGLVVVNGFLGSPTESMLKKSATWIR